MAAGGPATTERWLYGPAPDLLLGSGLLYLAAFPVLLALMAATDLTWGPLALFMVLFAASPHYGATLVRVYEQRAERRKYAFFTVYVSIGLLVLVYLGLRYLLLASMMFTVYVTWAPWHFAGQNYGLALMFFHRAGVKIEPRTKRMFHTSFFLSFLLAFLAMHAQGAVSSFAVQPDYVGSGEQVRMLRLGIPAGLSMVAGGVCAVVYLGLIITVVRNLRRDGASYAQLGPGLLLVVNQGLWFALPAVSEAVFGRGLYRLAFAMVWISAVHSLQYLWISTYFAEKSGQHGGKVTFLIKSVFAGAMVVIIPGMIFSPRALGTIPFEAGMGVLLFATINLHHFLLDGAIWKLRDGRVARALLRLGSSDDSDEPTQSRAPRLVWALGALCALATFVAEWDRSVGLDRGYENFDRARAASHRLDLLGRGSPKLQALLGRGLLETGDVGGAIREFQRGIDILPAGTAWDAIARELYLGMGQAHETQHDLDSALAAYDVLDTRHPDDAVVLARRANVFFILEHEAKKEPEREQFRRRGIEALSRAKSLAPGLDVISAELDRAVARDQQQQAAMDQSQPRNMPTQNPR